VLVTRHGEGHALRGIPNQDYAWLHVVGTGREGPRLTPDRNGGVWAWDGNAATLSLSMIDRATTKAGGVRAERATARFGRDIASVPIGEETRAVLECDREYLADNALGAYVHLKLESPRLGSVVAELRHAGDVRTYLLTSAFGSLSAQSLYRPDVHPERRNALIKGLGKLQGHDPSAASFDIWPGDALVTFTDGARPLFDWLCRQDLDDPRLAEGLAAWLSLQKPRDDATLCLIRVVGARATVLRRFHSHGAGLPLDLVYDLAH